MYDNGRTPPEGSHRKEGNFMRNSKGCWLQCAVAALALFCTLGLNINVFSVYLPYLTKLLELTPSQSSGYLLVRNIVTLGGVYLAKFYYEKLNIRVGLCLTMVMAIGALYLCSIVTGFYGLCGVAVLSGLCYGLGGMYPTAILIHRWLPRHEGVAMGICAASTGFALTIGAPILTDLIERFSLVRAMRLEMIFLAVCLGICFLVIRNYPPGELHYDPIRKKTSHRHKLNISWMFLAVMCMGTMGGAFTHLTIHYTTEGIDPYKISLIISVFGLVLTVSKFLLGIFLDLWGAYRTNWLFFFCAIAGCGLFSLGSMIGFAPAMVGSVLYGIGDAIPTVGITSYARDLSRPEDYASTQQQYQSANMMGSLLSTLISGPIAAASGNYRLFYIAIATLVVFAMVVTQITYAKKRNPRYR